MDFCARCTKIPSRFLTRMRHTWGLLTFDHQNLISASFTPSDNWYQIWSHFLQVFLEQELDKHEVTMTLTFGHKNLINSSLIPSWRCSLDIVFTKTGWLYNWITWKHIAHLALATDGTEANNYPETQLLFLGQAHLRWTEEVKKCTESKFETVTHWKDWCNMKQKQKTKGGCELLSRWHQIPNARHLSTSDMLSLCNCQSNLKF